MSQQSQRKGRLPILIAAVGVGVMLIASGTVTFVSQEKAVQVAIASTETALAPTLTATLTVTPSETPTITLTPTNTPTGTLLPTPTPTATYTPSPTPVPPKPPKPSADGYATPVEAPPTEIPPAAQVVPVPDGVVNIMLLGSDTRPDEGGYNNTDSIIIVSINRKAGTVNMLSLPRDLYVYIPGWTMNRINTAATHGSAVGWPGGGAGLLKETLLYNFGITVHYYARVEFSSFKEIVDILGGIDVPVDCPIQGWVLKAPRKERSDFSSFDEYEAYTMNTDNWEPYTIPVGVQHLDGYMALWYARLRERGGLGPNYTDYDRARRQQKVLRAILNKGKSLGLVTRVPELWTQYSDLVETDMGLGNMLQLAPVAADMDSSKINSYIMTPGNGLIGWKTPNGWDVLLPVPEEVKNLVTSAMQPPLENYLVANTVKVEVRNGTSTDRMDEVAADLLISEKGGGMLVFPTGSTDRQNQTVIYDFTGRSKGGQLGILKHLLGVKTDQVIVQVDPNRAFDYLVILGADYLNRTCTYNVPAPVEPKTPTPMMTPTP